MGRASRGVVLVSLLALISAACSGDDDGSPTGPTEVTGAATAATAATGPTATGDTAGAGATGGTGATPLVSGPLEPGTYSFDRFGETVTLTLGEGWEAFVFEGPEEKETALAEFFAFFNADHPAANLAFVLPTRVVDPAKEWDEADNLEPVPDDLVRWFEEHPLHEAGPVSDVTVAGLPGSAVDLVVADVPKNGWPACGGSCVLWVPVSVEHETGPLTDRDLVFAGALDEVDRQIVVEIGGQQLLIDIGAADQESFDAFLPLAEEVLATLTIG